MPTIAQAAETVTFNHEALSATIIAACKKEYQAVSKAQRGLVSQLISMLAAAKLPALSHESYKATLGNALNAKALAQSMGLTPGSAAVYATNIKYMALATSHGFAFTQENTPTRLQDVSATVKYFLVMKGLATAAKRAPSQAGSKGAGDKTSPANKAMASQDAVDAFHAAAEILLPDAGRDVQEALITLCKADRTRLAREIMRLVKSLV